MRYNGSEFYDDDNNFEQYMERRKRPENANDTLEKPIIWELLGDVAGMNILDMGCGDARFGTELFHQGCAAYTGIEGSRNMVEAAKKVLEGYKGTVVQTRIEDWDYPAETFDLVVSRLVIHYIQDVDTLFRQVHQSLKANGRFIFSVEHPVITSTLQPSGLRTDWVVDNYFKAGYREQSWLGGNVRKYHRTIEDYFTAMQKAGFEIGQLRESKPVRKHFIHEETYERRLRIPLFLFLAGTKRG
ncbi:methyltransferase domain-containing protein [Brevibacillus ruminantium]|uniref:Methyltransferase domain-containing protein n=1 Tax=Brevibacillus ruminantium TaxID=2950604 RepID=A0ABY4WFA2_9BACL|nr:class I SAM-dependent methyltransferase [Brevibacillus ruminantium]USG64808.1 methyltransferase domain-containing protein [Brevibacillus ruminantium]